MVNLARLLPSDLQEYTSCLFNLVGLLPSDLQEHPPRLSHLRRRVREYFNPHLHPHEPLLPTLPCLQLEEFLKRVPRAPDRPQHLARRYLVRRAVLDVVGVVLGRGVGLVELQSLSARTVDAGVSPRGEGHDGKDGVGGEMALVRSGEGKRGGIPHLEGDAIVLFHEEVRAREGEIVIKFRGIVIDMVTVLGKISLERTSRLFESLAFFFKLFH